MTMLIEDPRLEEELKARRKAWGSDHHDEVWQGVYFMAPLPNDEHQELVYGFTVILGAVIVNAGLGKVRPGVNLAGSDEDWERDYRAPDVVAFLNSTAAVNHDTFSTGAADFVVEITSPGDRTYEKIPFYSPGVRELLVVNRQTWTLELYRHQAGGLERIGQWRRRRARSSPAASYRFASGCFPASPGRRSKSPTSKRRSLGGVNQGRPAERTSPL